MKHKLLFLAALALIAASCAKTDVLQPQDEARTIIVEAAMPADKAEIDAPPKQASRVSLETAGKGLSLKWEENDKLKLCFKYAGEYYPIDAPIINSSISPDGKTAKFSITIPGAIPSIGTFNLYGVYQKPCGRDGFDQFEAGTANYVLAWTEDQNVTLDKPGTNGENGIIRPLLHFSQTNINADYISPISLSHTGWVVALHFKNNTAAEMDMPLYIKLNDRSGNAFAWNGHTVSQVKLNAESQEFSVHEGLHRNIHFTITQYDWLPLYEQKIPAGGSYIYYRWVASINEIPALNGTVYINNEHETSVSLPAKTVENGNVYHVYTEWNGTNFIFTKSDGTPL